MTPDQYRREGAEAMREAAADHCWSKRDILADAEKRQIDVGLSGRDYYGRRLEAELLSRAIRAIDVDEVLAAASTWKGPGETPHQYSPDYMAQGDCRVCGHTREAHQPAPNPVARLVEAARAALNYLENTEGEFGITLGSATGLRAALAAMEADQ